MPGTRRRIDSTPKRTLVPGRMKAVSNTVASISSRSSAARRAAGPSLGREAPVNWNPENPRSNAALREKLIVVFLLSQVAQDLHMGMRIGRARLVHARCAQRSAHHQSKN